LGAVIHSSDLPGSDEARDFVGAENGAGLTLILINAPTGHGPNLHRHPYEEVFVVHAGRGQFFVDDAQVEASDGDIVVAPAGSAHRFVNAGDAPLRVTAIHHAPQFDTEWLEPLSPEQRYWSSTAAQAEGKAG
jgi:mannose-6-phosphate isomerase-like protein (cupin superfamily)